MPEALEENERQEQHEYEIDDRHRFVLENVIQPQSVEVVLAKSHTSPR